MKLRALEVEQFRKFDRAIRIAGIDDGLNLVVGPNEMGKSTLFAALQAVLFERHRSQAQAVKSFQPAGHDGASPRVALQLELDGRPYRIEKRFLRRPSAELALPDGRHLHGEAAEEALDGLLGGGAGGRRGAPDGQGVWSLIWVGQGQSFVLPEIASGARATLQSVLDAELGEVMGGDHGSTLIARLDEALHELIYRRGQPKGRYREAAEAHGELEREIGRLEQERAELEHDLATLDEAQVEYERLRADQRAGDAEQELGELAARRDQVKVRHAEIREAEAALATARHCLADAHAEQARREALRGAVAAAGREREQATVVEVDLAGAAATAERLAGEQAGKVERLQATLDAAESHQRGLQRLAQAIRQRDDGRAALRAAASEVRFELEPNALERVRVDGRPLGETGRSLRIVDPLEIEIADVGRIQVRPVVADRGRLQSSLRDAERRIARELDLLGLRPPNPKARQLEFELAADVPNVRLAGKAAGLRAELTDPPCWPEAAAVDTALAEAERQIDGLVAQLRPARRELEVAVEARHAQHAAHGQAVERREQAERRLEQLRAELAEAERCAPDADLGARSAAMLGEFAVAEARLRQLHEQTPEESLERLEQHIAGLRQGVEERAAALRERELTIERLRARIQALAGGGLEERLAVVRRRFDELGRECAKYQGEVEALELLLRVLRDAERDAKERYVGPLVRRIRPYLEALFCGADLELDESFRITAVARSGGPEPFERLSEGTREQIAILARLAFAELLADQGRPAVVVLDDALVFSDDQRIERMFEILVRAAGKLQIIVLTCRERLFRDLPARRLRLEQVQAAGVH
jgi:energy-coupling factor transporter ATP-binding protein EcfA2